MQLKHLLVFLLVFLVSVADASVYSKNKPSEYHQSSKVFQNRKFSAKSTKYFAFNKSYAKDYFLAYFFSNTLLEVTFHQKTVLILKLQKQLYQEIASLNNKHIFLIHKITSSNSISNLYIV